MYEDKKIVILTLLNAMQDVLVKNTDIPIERAKEINKYINSIKTILAMQDD